MPQITPFLWFDGVAEEAMAFYTSIFDDSRIGHVERYPDESLDPHFAGMGGKVITGAFELAGTPFLCLDGGPQFPINPSISFFCVFSDPAAAREAWARLSEDGKVMMDLRDDYAWSPLYGWVQDRYGVTWQLTVGQTRASAGQTGAPTGPAAPAGQGRSTQIFPALMFTGPAAGRAEEAMHLYTTLFDASGIDALVPYEAGDGDTAGLVKHGRYHLGDHSFTAMDSTHPHGFTFSEGVSLFVGCRDQEEIDRYWTVLTADGGAESQCGWCKDRFGVSWQIIPEDMGALLGAGPAAVQAMMRMHKIDIAELERAGRPS